MPALSDIEAKLQRGFDHLDELDREIAAFLLSHPYSVIYEADTDGWSTAVFRVIREPPVLFGIIAGEAVGQFRSSLDHLMARLVRLEHPSTNRPPLFPIYGSKAEFARTPKNGKSPRDHIRESVRPQHFTLLESLQPYHRSHLNAIEVDKLTQLKRFSNMDKHDSIHPAYARPTRLSPPRHSDILAFEWEFGPPYMLDDETRLYRIKVRSDSKVQMPPEVSTTVVLGPGPKYSLDTRILRAYGNRTRDIIEQFRSLTPEFQS